MPGSSLRVVGRVSATVSTPLGMLLPLSVLGRASVSATATTSVSSAKTSGSPSLADSARASVACTVIESVAASVRCKPSMLAAFCDVQGDRDGLDRVGCG